MTPGSLQGQDIVMLSAVPWGFLWQRPQQLARQFERNNRVIYVELGRVAQWRCNLRTPLGRLWEVSRNLVVFTLPVPIPVRYPWLAALAEKVLIPSSLRALFGRLRIGAPILWICHPLYGGLIGRLGEKLACFDCMDDFRHYPGLPGRTRGALWAREERLLGYADLVVVTAHELARTRRSLAKRILLVPNAADVEHFARATRELPTPADMRSIPRPIVGYVGAIYAWFDTELVETIARAHPEWSLVLIGPVDTDVRRLRELSNVFFLGPKPYQDLPPYLRQFNVATIPFRSTPLVESTNPIKLFEYLAAGLPVVATQMPEVQQFAGLVRIARTADEFERHVALALAEPPSNAPDRLAAAGQNSWEARFQLIEEAIQEAFAMKYHTEADPRRISRGT